MCQYSERCPTTKHRPGTRCPVIVRRDNQNRKLASALVLAIVMVAAFAIVYFLILN